MKTAAELREFINQSFLTKSSSTDWIVLIKEIRAASGVGILEAQKIALAHHGWRQWCNRRMNSDQKCRKQAIFHLKMHGPASIVALVEGSFKIIDAAVKPCPE